MNKLLIGILAISLHFSAFADEGKRADIKELMELTNVDAMLDAMYAQMDQMFVGVGQQLGVQASEQAIFDDYMKKIAAAMKQDMSWEKMEAPITEIYLKNYTGEEIKDLLVFYRSETGRSMIEKMPTVMGESMVISQELMQDFMPKITQLAREMGEDLKAHRQSAR